MREQAAVDASQFNDSVAEQTDWTPLKPGGMNFRTHKLVQVRPERMGFKATLGMKLFSSGPRAGQNVVPVRLGGG